MLLRRHRDRLKEFRNPQSGKPDYGAGELPDGDPSDGWKNKQIEAYAQANGIDLGGASKKADMLAAIDAHRAAAETGGGDGDAFDPNEHDVDAVIGYLAGLDDDDAEAHDAEVVRVVEAEKAAQNRSELLEQIEGAPAPEPEPEPEG
ncbi:hypothetical protein [Georgenia faecalis]|uniref:hypothetical protein n=1 Tax=Georgenia faecalis TaxID=2483799 RepID=UPI000FDCAA2E|nr:hypothetical protein [Georgenia faecalis]